MQYTPRMEAVGRTGRITGTLWIDRFRFAKRAIAAQVVGVVALMIVYRWIAATYATAFAAAIEASDSIPIVFEVWDTTRSVVGPLSGPTSNDIVVHEAHMIPTDGAWLTETYLGPGEPGLQLLLVPVVVLLAAGAFVTLLFGVRSVDRGAKAGASVALGYTPLLLFSLAGRELPMVVAVALSEQRPIVNVPPDLVPGVIAAIAYPIVVGGLGGILAVLLIRGIGSAWPRFPWANPSGE